MESQAGPPNENVPAPASVISIAAGRPMTVVWRNELGGITFEIGSAADRCFVKWAPAASTIGLAILIAGGHAFESRPTPRGLTSRAGSSRYYSAGE